MPRLDLSDDQRAAVVMRWQRYEQEQAAAREHKGLNEDGKAGGRGRINLARNLGQGFKYG